MKPNNVRRGKCGLMVFIIHSQCQHPLDVHIINLVGTANSQFWSYFLLLNDANRLMKRHVLTTMRLILQGLNATGTSNMDRGHVKTGTATSVTASAAGNGGGRMEVCSGIVGGWHEDGLLSTVTCHRSHRL